MAMSSKEAQETSQKCSNNPAEEVVKELNFFPDDLDQEEDASGGEEANKEAISTGEGSFASSSLASDTPKEFNFLPSDLGEEKSLKAAKTMSSGNVKPDLPPHKRLKPSSPSPGPEAPKEIDFLPKDIGQEKGLTSDAQVSKDGIKASQLADQPFQMWYGKHGPKRGACVLPQCGARVFPRRVIFPKPRDEPDSSSVSVPVAVEVQSGNRKGLVWSDGSRSPSPTEAKVFVEVQSDYVGRVEGDGGGLPTGKGMAVAILDSGIYAEHTAFHLNGVVKGKIIPDSYNATSADEMDFTDHVGHGTQCAGLVCGNLEHIQTRDNSTVPFEGIAPDALVMACKVVPAGEITASIEAVFKAIDRIIKINQECERRGLAEKVNVISMSFGMKGFNRALTKKIQEAVYNDIIVICAGSNEGRNGRQPITYPARLGHVLCIGSCTPGGNRSDFSPVGRELDFLAPGQGLWAPTIGGNMHYDRFDGTSFATPLVAGIVCQILEDVRRLSADLYDKVHNVWCMREILKEMAAVSGKHCDEIGYGKLDPKQYFEKPDVEKKRIISEILKM